MESKKTLTERVSQIETNEDAFQLTLTQVENRINQKINDLNSKLDSKVRELTKPPIRLTKPWNHTIISASITTSEHDYKRGVWSIQVIIKFDFEHYERQDCNITSEEIKLLRKIFVIDNKLNKIEVTPNFGNCNLTIEFEIRNNQRQPEYKEVLEEVKVILSKYREQVNDLKQLKIMIDTLQVSDK